MCCEICGKEFIPYRKWQKVCSGKCRTRKYLNKKILGKKNIENNLDDEREQTIIDFMTANCVPRQTAIRILRKKGLA